MKYAAYQAQSDLLDPMRDMARLGMAMMAPWLEDGGNPILKRASAALELVARATLTHARPDYRIETVTVGNREVAVTEEAVKTTPFATLLRFRKDIDAPQPRVLLVAPMSGHFATLLRGTLRTLLPDHDVYITDWHNARNVPLSDGAFGLDAYVDHVIDFLHVMGPGAHVVAVCQPCVQVLAAAALMAQDDDPAQPRSMTLMAGPIDTRVNPTAVNELATGKDIAWFEDNLIATVPSRYPGGGRRVYPGFLQISAFISMNWARHYKAHLDLFDFIVEGDEPKAEAIKSFYDEYVAVLDLPAEFYIETVSNIFQKFQLPKGEMTVRGIKVDPTAIRKTALLTVEGERDDICAVGQTLAAHDLCTGIRSYRRRHHMQPGVGHYGVFSGKRWDNQIYPIVRHFIGSHD